MTVNYLLLVSLGKCSPPNRLFTLKEAEHSEPDIIVHLALTQNKFRNSYINTPRELKSAFLKLYYIA